ncbi:unnamed protein product, partial [Prorocentrum cordatum]
MVRLSQQSDFRLDLTLAARYYGQNRTKQDVVPALRGRQLTKATISELIASGCCGGYQLKHLEAWFNAVNSNANEMQVFQARLHVCWAEPELKQMCGSLARKLRSMMGGTAKEDPDHTRTLTTRTVYRYWNLVTFALQATVQRIRYWQAVVRQPYNHTHLLSVFFGQVRRELNADLRCPPTFLEDGSLNVDE